MVVPIEPTKIPARVEEIVDFLDMRSVWSNPTFDGTVYEDAYPLFEGLYRYAVRGNYHSSTQLRAKQSLERAAAETWARNQLAAQLFIGRILMIQEIPAYGSFPISSWPVERLVEEWIRLKELLALLAEIRLYLGLGGTANSIAARSAGQLVGSTILRASGTAGFAITLISGVGLTFAVWRCNQAAQEIEEEMENTRIPAGEMEQSDWDSIEHRVLDRMG